MEPDRYYFDPTINRNVCIKFETTGYCADLMTCPYLHRRKEESMPLPYPPPPPPAVIGLPPPPPPKIPHLSIPRPLSVSESPMFIPSRRKVLFDDEEQYKPKAKVDLMPSLRKRLPQSNKKPQNCNQCKRLQPQDNLFCNSFCGHLFCFDCTTHGKACNECTIELDTGTAEQFFRWYCRRCESQNLAKGGDHLCKDCKLEQQLHQAKLKKEQEKLDQTNDSTLICIICMHRKKEYAVFPCAHMLYCQECVKHVDNCKICFFCNRAVTNSCRIYY